MFLTICFRRSRRESTTVLLVSAPSGTGGDPAGLQQLAEAIQHRGGPCLHFCWQVDIEKERHGQVFYDHLFPGAAVVSDAELILPSSSIVTVQLPGSGSEESGRSSGHEPGQSSGQPGQCSGRETGQPGQSSGDPQAMVPDLSGKNPGCSSLGPRTVPLPVHDLAIGGFVCGAFSSLNSNRTRNLRCLLDRTLSSGETFGHFHDAAVAPGGPGVVVLENSPNMEQHRGGREMVEAPVDHLHQLFGARGFHGLHRIITVSRY